MKVLRSSDPRIVPDRLKATIVELTTSTMSTPTAMSSLGVTSWSPPKLLMLLACAVPANPVRLSGVGGAVTDFAALADTEPDPGVTAAPDTTPLAAADLPSDVTTALAPRWSGCALFGRSPGLSDRNGLMVAGVAGLEVATAGARGAAEAGTCSTRGSAVIKPATTSTPRTRTRRVDRRSLRTELSVIGTSLPSR